MDSLLQPYGRPAVGLGHDEKATSSVAARPSDRAHVRVGVVGIGRWGKNYLSVVQKTLGGSLTAVCDASPEALAATPIAAQGVRTFTSLGAMLDADVVDAVVLATPSPSHGSLGLEVLRAGLHLLVEKPLALTISDAERLTTSAEERGLVLAVGHLSLHVPAVGALVDRVRAGAIGEVRRMEAWRTSDGGRTSRENALWSLAPHDAAAAIEIFGGPPTNASAVVLAERDGVPDAVDLVLRFPNAPGTSLERRAVVHLSRLAARRRREVVVEGSLGEAHLDEVVGALVVTTPRGLHRATPASRLAPLDLQVQDFVASIREGRAPRSDGRAGIEVVRALSAADRSLGLCAGASRAG